MNKLKDLLWYDDKGFKVVVVLLLLVIAGLNGWGVFAPTVVDMEFMTPNSSRSSWGSWVRTWSDGTVEQSEFGNHDQINFLPVKWVRKRDRDGSYLKE